MPVSSFPCCVTLLLVAIPLQGLAKGKRAFVAASLTSCAVALASFRRAYAPGWSLTGNAGAVPNPVFGARGRATAARPGVAFRRDHGSPLNGDGDALAQHALALAEHPGGGAAGVGVALLDV